MRFRFAMIFLLAASTVFASLARPASAQFRESFRNDRRWITGALIRPLRPTA